uniref:Uncharacterized protein n=1 Tax=Glossina palpalis gambiensis TaxID=67801 RepID=A0A1B0AXQ3_9MUSC
MQMLWAKPCFLIVVQVSNSRLTFTGFMNYQFGLAIVSAAAHAPILGNRNALLSLTTTVHIL